MGCTSSYLEPNGREKESANVIKLLNELGIETNSDGIYGNINELDKDTDILCGLCQNIDVSKHSLELQIWWRDHQKADTERIKKELENDKCMEAKKIAIDKLTPYERTLLEIKNLEN